MYEAREQKYISIPNNPSLIRALFDKMSVRVSKGLLKAIKEVKENPEKYQNIPGPYLSMIARYGNTNKKTTMTILGEMERAKIVKSKLVPYKVRNNIVEKVRSYELLVDIKLLEWIENVEI
jgi:hypothetical protein